MTQKEKEAMEKRQKDYNFTREIRQFYHETIRELRDTVSHSRKGKPHKQAWGMHIVRE